MFTSKKEIDQLRQELEAKFMEELSKQAGSLGDLVSKSQSELQQRLNEINAGMVETQAKALKELASRVDQVNGIIARDSTFMNTTIDEMQATLKEAREHNDKLASAIELLARALSPAVSAAPAASQESKPSKKKNK